MPFDAPKALALAEQLERVDADTRVGDYLSLAADCARALREAVEECERLRAKASVIGGEWCLENRAAGRGPCGACAVCCHDLVAEHDRLRALALEACDIGVSWSGDDTVDGTRLSEIHRAVEGK